MRTNELKENTDDLELRLQRQTQSSESKQEVELWRHEREEGGEADIPASSLSQRITLFSIERHIEGLQVTV